MLSILLLSTACDDDYEGFTEVINPLRCTIPGKLQFDIETQNSLNKYNSMLKFLNQK